MQLAEKYRPSTWAEFIGQEKLIKRVREIIGREAFGEDGGEAFWLSGPTGTGKTTLAHLLAKELGCTEWTIEEIDGDACSVDRVRKIASGMHLAGWGGTGWKVYIVNEAHAMTPKAVQVLLTTLKRIPGKCLFVFTTTETGDLFGSFSGPLLSRCKVFPFTSQGLCKLFATRAREIAVAEDMDGQAPAKYLRLVQNCHNSMREVLQKIDAGEMKE